MTITVSTDGSALGNPNGPMGWAWADHAGNAARTPGHQHDGDSDAGGATNGTNQIGELCAVLEALRTHAGAEPLTIETDSQYAINCSTKWVHGWKRNGWKNSQKKPVKNAPLIKAIDAEISKREGPVKFVWVKGHNGNPGNEKVDDLAHTYSGDARSGVKDGYLPLEGWQSLLSSDYARGVDIPSDAQLLIDGKITGEQYHIGRGQDTSASETDDNDNTDANAAASADASSEAEDQSHGAGSPDSANAETSVPSLADRLSEPEGVPDYDFADSDEHSNSNKAEIHDDDGSDSTGVEADGNTETPVPQDSSTLSEDSEETGASSTQSMPALRRENSGTPQTTLPRASGLTVSGTVRVTPPPQASPTYQGRPRHIKGSIVIDGYVEGDGTLRLADSPIVMNRR